MYSGRPLKQAFTQQKHVFYIRAFLAQRRSDPHPASLRANFKVKQKEAEKNFYW